MVAWRRWRRTRPFWGGLLLVLAGLELTTIPLSGVLSHGGVKLVIYIGIGGVFGLLIGIMLLAAGILAWLDTVHRVFYGVAAIALGLASFPATNLGGFFLGMLLAITGGAAVAAWSTDPPPAAVPRSAEPRLPRQRENGVLALFPIPLLLLALAVPAARTHADAWHWHWHYHGSHGLWHHHQPGPRRVVVTRAGHGLVASDSRSQFDASSVTITRLGYTGNVLVPTAGSRPEVMMRFTATRIVAAHGVQDSSWRGGESIRTTGEQLVLFGGVVVYATVVTACTKVLGCVTITPGDAANTLARITGPEYRGPLTMTHMVADQPLLQAGEVRYATLNSTLTSRG